MYYSAVILTRVCVFTRARRTGVGVPIVSRPQSFARASASSTYVPERRRSTRRLRRSTRGSMTRTRDPATTRASASRRIAGVRELATTHDVFLLDQFGVLHDGREAYADALTCVRELKRLGKEVYVLSNSSRRRRDDRETRGDGVRRGRVRGRDDERRDDGAVSRARGVVVVDDVA